MQTRPLRSEAAELHLPMTRSAEVEVWLRQMLTHPELLKAHQGAKSEPPARLILFPLPEQGELGI